MFLESIRTKQISEKNKESNVDDFFFVQNFLMLFINCIVECGIMGDVTTMDLQHLQPNIEIRSLNWCDYIIQSLKKSKKSWNREEPNSYFNGPIFLLILVYLCGTKFEKMDTPTDVHPTKFWSKENILKRSDLELNNGGFGKGDIKKIV
ncbi:hypothetical protein HanIR_Chr08g0378841 [Helianthus annuus]|nr:hypothetical protein HanIR_Chr08g0378841 [Helianthus annuus]KAJ0720048.1 hypothetical protein HanLR1_Chr08g0288661 [Helianthus annuus]